MQLCQKHELEDYWGSFWLTRVPFTEVMPRDCYEILTCLHFANNEHDQPNSGDPNYGPLWKIQDLVNLCESKYLAVYAPQHELPIDESIIKFKGRVHLKQYLPSKPTRWGITQFALCESKSGYAFQIITYCGKIPQCLKGDPPKLGTFMYPHKSTKWYFTIYHWLRDVALVNRYIIYCADCKSNGGNPVSPRLFREQIIQNLLEGYVSKAKQKGRQSTDTGQCLVERHSIGQYKDKNTNLIVLFAAIDTQLDGKESRLIISANSAISPCAFYHAMRYIITTKTINGLLYTILINYCAVHSTLCIRVSPFIPVILMY
ncbi:uncharacterized protein LOC143250352 [Tachypleus tridentatus]|uniref:uncharacterized protein LOC143250352 n=1 Tax=Tachypleus tridentatus TaxID=6853 RepID=UPI003FD57E9E